MSRGSKGGPAASLKKAGCEKGADEARHTRTHALACKREESAVEAPGARRAPSVCAVCCGGVRARGGRKPKRRVGEKRGLWPDLHSHPVEKGEQSLGGRRWRCALLKPRAQRHTRTHTRALTRHTREGVRPPPPCLTRDPTKEEGGRGGRLSRCHSTAPALSSRHHASPRAAALAPSHVPAPHRQHAHHLLSHLPVPYHLFRSPLSRKVQTEKTQKWRSGR